VDRAREANSLKTAGILRSNAAYAVTHFAATFEPHIAFARKLPNAAEGVMKQCKAPHFQAQSDSKYVIRETNKKFYYFLDFQTFFCQTLGLEPWTANLDSHFDALSIGLNKMDVSRIKRLGFVVTVQLPLEMVHAEMCELMFGSFLIDRESLLPVYGKLDDLLLQLHGRHKGIKCRTVIAPQTAEQAKSTFLATSNLDVFVEPKYIDTCVKDHLERVSVDSLHIQMEMVREDVPLSAVRTFLDDSLEGAEKIAEGTVLRIKGLKLKTGEIHGDGE
jgi:hypothetical protein